MSYEYGQIILVPVPDGRWALTARGIAWLKEDRELSDR